MATKDEIVQQIRQAAERTVQARVEPLAAAISEIRTVLEQLSGKVDRLSGAVPETKDLLPEGALAGLLDRLDRPAPAPAATPSTGPGFDWPAYKEGVRAIDAARSQVDILNAYLSASSEFVHRVGLFVLKGDRVAGWKGKGFAAFGGNDDAVKVIALAPADDPHLARVFSEEKTIFVTPTGNEPFFSKLPGPRPAVAALVPMTIKDKVAAFLYADRIEGAAGTANFHAVEVLTLLTTLSIDTLATRKKVPNPSLTAAGQVPSEEGVVVAEAAEVEEPTVTRAMPLAPAAEPPAPRPVPPVPAAQPPIAPPSAQRLSIVIPTTKDTRIAEEPPKPVPPPPPPPPRPAAPPAPAFELKVEPAPEPPPPPPPAPKPTAPPAPAAEHEAKAEGGKGAGLFAMGGDAGKSTQFIPPAHLVKKTPGIGPSAPPPVGMSVDEARRHDDAKRFARLLVSEIKLYNEGRITEGRREGKVYDRLKDDIDRSRQMYDDRIPEELRSKTNYFYEELVRILADGKPELLGI